jgi:phosphoenolpyruvate carboxykinase (GTP)
MALTTNQAVLTWMDKQIALCKPDSVVWIDGSEAQLDEIRALAVSEGTMIKLNEEKLPGCYLHRTDPNDVARVEGRTYICCEKEEDAGPTNHWMAPAEMYAKLEKLYDGSMKGRVMYVIT